MAKQTFTTGAVLTAAQMTSLQQTALGGGSTTAKTASYVLLAADAGTVVQMNSASATTITVNTALFAQGDTVEIQNVGAGVCTVTAGTATVNTSGSLALNQFDAGTLYFNSTSASFFFGAGAGDITGVTAGNGLSGGGSSGAVSVAIDTAITVDKTTAQTLTNKTLTSPALTTPTISTATTNGDILYGTGSGALQRLGIGSSAQVLTVASGIPSWATPAAGSSGPTFKATRTGGNQSFSVSTTTKIQYNTEIWDSDSCYDPTTNYRFTPNKAGYYEVTVSAYLTQGSTSDVYLYIHKNGTGNSLFYAGATATSSSVQINALVDMNGSTDYLEGFIYAEGASPSVIGTGSYTYFNSVFIRSL